MDDNDGTSIGRLRGNLGDLAEQLQRLVELLYEAPEVSEEQLQHLCRLRATALRLEKVLDLVERAGATAGEAFPAANPSPTAELRSERRHGVDRRAANPPNNSFLRHLAGTPLDRRKGKDRRMSAEAAMDDWRPVIGADNERLLAQNLVDFATARAERDGGNRRQTPRRPSGNGDRPVRSASHVSIVRPSGGDGTALATGSRAGGEERGAPADDARHGEGRSQPRGPGDQD